MGKSTTFIDKMGFTHTQQELEETRTTLATAKNGDVIGVSFWNKQKLEGGGYAFILIDGKEWFSETKMHQDKNTKTLQELVDEGKNLKIIGHWGDGKNCDHSGLPTFWNDCRDYTLLDLMTLNKYR